MTVVRLFNVQPDIYASERILLGEIAFCAALPEKFPSAALLINSAPLSISCILYHVLERLSICLSAFFGEIEQARANSFVQFYFSTIDKTGELCYNGSYGKILYGEYNA